MWHPGSEILRVSQHAEVDRLAELSGVSIETLMENAGRRAANEIAKRWSGCRTTVYCGPGNNGGDGFVIARHLAARGWDVEAVKVGDHSHASKAAASMAKRWQGKTRGFNPGEPIHAELVIDAIYGAGLSRALAPELSQLFEDIEMADVPVVAIDIPSGIQGDAAVFVGDAQPWTAKLCVTFFRKKPAHVLFPARQHCGEIVCVDIGIGDAMISALTQLPLAEADSLRRCDEIASAGGLPNADTQAHKHVRGHCYVMSGPASMTGAARMAGRAALRSGAGLVTLLAPEDAVSVLASQVTSIMVRSLKDNQTLATLLQDKRPSAFVAGPGMGVSAGTKRLVMQILTAGKPVVLDADGLTAFESDPAELFAGLDARSVLTPHVGEFERLFPGVLKSSTNRIDAARIASKRSGAVVLLKGPDTVVATPQGDAAVNTNAPPWLATAGSGDVLAGIIGGLISQGMGAFEAARSGAFLHGECGRLAGRGLIAEDLPELLPRAMYGF